MSRTRPARSRNDCSLPLGPAEQRHQQGARHVEPLGRGRVHRGVEAVALPGQRLQLAAEPPGRQHEDRQQDQREQRDLPGQAEHHHRGQHQADDVGDDAGQGRGEGLLRADHVVVQPADQGAGLGAGEERQRHPLHVLEDLGAHVEDQALADPRREPAGAEATAAASSTASPAIISRQPQTTARPCRRR